LITLIQLTDEGGSKGSQKQRYSLIQKIK